MKIPPDHDDLLNEVFSDEKSAEVRSRSLNDTLRAVRRRRRFRNAVRYASSVAALGILTAILWYWHAPAPESVAHSYPSEAAMTSPIVPGTSIRLVSDEELLAMFPDRPVALVGPPENRQFVFLDERPLPKSTDKSLLRNQRL